MFEDADKAEDFSTSYKVFMEAAKEHILSLKDTNVTTQIGHRFSGLLPAKLAQDNSICIIGAGSIGGWTARILAKLGFTDMTIYDDDIVEPHNVGVQPYSLIHLGMPKVEALRDMILLDCGFEVSIVPEKILSINRRYDFVIFAVDSIETRRNLYTNSVSPNKAIIDARMSLGTWNCILLPTEVSTRHTEYQNVYLFPPEDALQEPCTARSVVDTPLSVASYICSAVRYMLKNPPTVSMDNLADPEYRFKWVKSFNALTWDSITHSPEFKKMQSKYIALLNTAQPAQTQQTQQQPQTWQYGFNVGHRVILKGGLRATVTAIDPLSETFTANDATYRAKDVRGWE